MKTNIKTLRVFKTLRVSSNILMILCFCFLSGYAYAETLVLATVSEPTITVYKISKAVLGEALNRNGFELILKSYPPKRAELLTTLGKVDGDSHRIYDFNKDKPELIQVPEPVQTIRQSVFSKNITFQVDGWKSLSPYKVIYVAGIKFAEKGLRGVVPDKNLVPVDTIETAFKMLAKERGDILITSPETGFATIRKLSLKNSGIRLLSPPLVDINLYTYLHKRHIALVDKISDTLKTMKADGTYHKIIETIADEEN